MSSPGIHLTRTAEKTAEIDAVAERLGGRVPLETLLGDLPRHARRSWAPGRAVRRAYRLDAADQRDERWWPQGVTTSADASLDGRVAGRRLVVMAWYAKVLPGDPEGGQGVRVTVLDLDTRRYRHVLLVRSVLRDGQPSLEPVRAHAGGLVWHGPYLHVAATARGFHTCRLDDLLRLPDGSDLALHGYRYVLPVRFSHRGGAEEGHEKLRYSFFSLDRTPEQPGEPASLVVGEYALGTRRTRRLARFPLDPATHLPATDPDGLARPSLLVDGAAQMQGAAVVHGRWYLTVSQGPWMPGSVLTGVPGSAEGLRRHRWAVPMGVEDIGYWPQVDQLWSASEHPHRRWVFPLRRSWFDRRSAAMTG